MYNCLHWGWLARRVLQLPRQDNGTSDDSGKVEGNIILSAAVGQSPIKKYSRSSYNLVAFDFDFKIR